MRREPVCIQRVIAWTERTIAPTQIDALERFAAWLRSEAVAAGGLGPAEKNRIWDRHICDSLAFAAAWPPGAEPATAIDIGTIKAKTPNR